VTQQVNATIERLLARMRHKLEIQQRHVQHARQTLHQLDPGVVLRRGYGLIRDEKGAVVKGRATGIKPGDRLVIELHESIINAGVQDVRKKT